MTMTIRELRKEDLPQLAHLYKQFWGQESSVEKMSREWEAIAAEKNHILLIGVKDKKVMASVTGIVCRELYGDCRPFLVVENMIVDKPFRRCGAGQALLSVLESKAKAMNCAQMVLVTESEREDACCFYEKNGFQKNNKGYKKLI